MCRSDLQRQVLLKVEACCGTRGGVSASAAASAAFSATWLQGSMTVDLMTKSRSQVCIRRPASSFWLRFSHARAVPDPGTAPNPIGIALNPKPCTSLGAGAGRLHWSRQAV